ncbi:hypothetical protein Ahy_B05g073954 isoform B [Arachis hypogaea]|uniref:Uncharacterized protein n=1 Tax=Arachis hypogaea TaxID=3818 RepID=A0A444YXH0_ARAHY|nr:hypothetical protein Ahy_B05g073954 isoform B [Arachis hypogaea]
MLTMVVVQNRDKLGDIDRKRVRCYAIAPARCMSLNLAVRYADVINSVVLQASIRISNVLLAWLQHLYTCISEEKLLKDPRRLYAPGRLYHIVERKPFRMGRFPPVVRTAVPVDGRFEHIILSCNATSDHAIIWIEKEAQKALDLIIEKDHDAMEIPEKQKMVRQETLTRHKEEHRAALQRAKTLDVPHAYTPPSEYGTFDDEKEEEEEEEKSSRRRLKGGSSSFGSTPNKTNNASESWDELIERLFDKDEHGHMVLKK